MKLKPEYTGSPIAHISSLSSLLGCNEILLNKIASSVNKSYVSFVLERPGKRNREVLDAKPNLKRLQKIINSRIMSNVIFPSYLMGGIKDCNNKRDYYNNSLFHLHKKTIISLDVVDFFPSIKKAVVLNVYKNLFRFSPNVSNILADLTTYNGALPQGGCTSTYIANLIFFNNEFDVVNRLKNIGVTYTRLLDDITLSSKKVLSNDEVKFAISIVAGMVKKYGLELHKEKTKVGYVSSKYYDCNVTGVCVRGLAPKMPKKNVDRIRSAVRECEILYDSMTPYSLNYHKIWNVVSGRVAQLGRFKQRESRQLRDRLLNKLPLYDDKRAQGLVKKVENFNKKIISIRNGLKKESEKLKAKNEYNIIMYRLGILSRNNKLLSKKLRENILSI